MSIITPRVPKIDWSKRFDRRWNGGNAGVTHAFNALSFIFPQGERFFIDAVREVVSGVDISSNPELSQAVKNFIAQESIHTQQHIHYNEILHAQGFENVVYDYIERLEAYSKKTFSPLTNLAVVCAYEHYTAILGNYILKNPSALANASADMALVWGWHAAEETEHKAVCFDLYQAAKGSWLHRVLNFIPVSLNFLYMFTRLYFSLLYRDGCLRPSRILGTAAQSLQFFFGSAGIAYHILWYGLCYLSPTFHPWNQNNRRELQTWLTENQSRFRQVSGA